MYNKSLPIYAHCATIQQAVAQNPVTILTSDTGQGKSTQVAQYLLNAGWKVLVTEPRRLAARTVAERVATEYGTAIGNIVGYRTSMERKDSPKTRCLYVTDGVAMIREILGKRQHNVLIIDEVHEWSIEIETLVAWAKFQISKGIDYKVVLMSATIDAEGLSQYFGGAPIIDIPGRQHEVVELSPTGDEMADDAAKLLKQGRNVLVFVPGKPEIDETIAKLKQRGLNAEILPLHGNLSPEDQAKCFAEYRRPKCIVSTNVAQTSVTVPDIDAVVDSGMERRLETVNGIEGLYLRPISLADRTQRMGRAGRTKPGVFVDWCPKAPAERSEYPVPAILRERLDMTVLRLAVAGYDVEELEFFHQPSVLEIQGARRSLRVLGCLDDSGNVTKVGKTVSRLPVSAQYGCMIVRANKLGVLDDVVTIAAIMETDGLVNQTCPSCRQIPGKKACTCWTQWIGDPKGSDHLAMLMLYKACQGKSKDEMKKVGVNLRSYFLVRELRSNIIRALDRKRFQLKSDGDRTKILQAICAGMAEYLYEDQMGYLYSPEGVERRLCHGSIAYGSHIVGQPFDLHYRGKHGMGTLNLVRMASGVDPLWVAEAVPHLVRVESGIDPHFDEQTGTVRSTTYTYLGDRLIDARYVDDSNHAGELQWSQWNAEQVELVVPDLDDINVEIPQVFEAQYGTHAIFGHPLMAYAFLTENRFGISGLDPAYVWVWTRDREEAEREHARFVDAASAARTAHQAYLDGVDTQEKVRQELDNESARAWQILRDGAELEARLLTENILNPANIDWGIIDGVDALVNEAIRLRDEASRLVLEHEGVISTDVIEELLAVDVDDSEMPADAEAIRSYIGRAQKAVTAAQQDIDLAEAEEISGDIDEVATEPETDDGNADFLAALDKLRLQYAR